MVQLTDADHYIRYNSSIAKNMDTDGHVSPVVFMLKYKDTDGAVSGDHFEYNNRDYRKVLESLESRYHTSKNGFLIKLNCGDAINDAEIKKQGSIISFEKETEDQSHTSMRGLTVDDGHIPSLLVHHIKEIKRIKEI